MDNLRLAHKRASRDKSYYKEVKMVNSDPDKYLKKIQDMLLSKTYYIGFEDYSCQIINDKGKDRTLMKLSYFPHRIIQWAIMLVIEDTFIKTFTTHTCASIPGRGIRRTNELMVKYLADEDNTKYCLQIDVKRFYYSLNHEILKDKLEKKFKDKNLLWLMFLIIDSFPGEVGVPIGSYLSQYLANFYLSDFDHYLKEELQLKYVVRYMDDIVVMAATKEELHDAFAKMEKYINDEKLEIKSNHQIYAVDVRGVDFVGYRYFRDYILLRKKCLKRMKRLCRKVKEKQDGKQPLSFKEWCGVNSYAGWLIWCNSWRLYDKWMKPIIPAMVGYYRTNISEKRSVRYRNKLLAKQGRRTIK